MFVYESQGYLCSNQYADKIFAYSAASLVDSQTEECPQDVVGEGEEASGHLAFPKGK